MNRNGIKEAFRLLLQGKISMLKSKIIIKYGSRQALFTEFYKRNIWGASVSISGPGSELQYTRNIIRELPLLLKSFEIMTINDAPCGDFNYMKEIDLKGISYTGFDIVDNLIEDNNKRYAQSNICFKKFDVVDNILPAADLILSRDMLIHFSFRDAQKTIENFHKSGSKYLLTNTYPDVQVNMDIKTGNWRPINLSKGPYNFSLPLYIIEEYVSAEHGRKQLALYQL